MDPSTDISIGTAAVANPYGLDSLWRQGDIVSHGTLLVLLVMSLATWSILVTKLIEQNRLFRRAKAASAESWLSEGAPRLAPDSPFLLIAASGITAIGHHEGVLVERIDLNTWISLAIGRTVTGVVNGLQSGLAVLATVGSTAPFVGLFGTVWGIYHALTAIGDSGQASIDKVAGPVGEALIMTAMGLAVAVPAVLGYNWMVRRNKLAAEMVRAFAADLHCVLLRRDAEV